MSEHSVPGPAPAVRGAMLERLRPLQPRDRDVLMRAAAIGREFDLGLLAAVSSGGEARVRSAVRRACRLQILEPAEDTPGRFRFRHALTHDVVYAELISEQLRPLHRDIATALERLAPERREQLAYHWWAAGDPRRGARYNEEAGDRARAVHAGAVALLHYRRALDLAPQRSAAHARLETKLLELAECVGASLSQ